MQHQLKEILKQEQNLVVVGGNWGDEGKGKIIDKILEHYDVTVRFSGGANAGHTVFTPDNKKLVSHLIPCGLAQQKICVLARGEFFNLKLFCQELTGSKKVLNNKLPEIFIDQQAPLFTPYHELFERYIELARGGNKVGTTNKGIGPLEGIYKLRISPLVGHLLDEKILLQGLQNLYNILGPCLTSPEFKKLNLKVPSPKEVLKDLLFYTSKIKNKITDTGYLLSEYEKNGKRILFEGAQALGLDAFWGTYPFVSSGNSAAFGAAVGTGLPMQKFDATLMVIKTLPTRVGNGPFISEMWERELAMEFAKKHPEMFKVGNGLKPFPTADHNSSRELFLAILLEKINHKKATHAEMSQYFQVLGDERGATTGRGRSVGFLDIPWLQYAIRINGPKWLALTRFDMLSKIHSIPVVVAYKYKNKILPAGQLPAAWEMKNVKPIFEQWPVFKEDIQGISEEKKLPLGAKKFIARLEKHLKTPILLVGTGPGRDALVVRSDGQI